MLSVLPRGWVLLPSPLLRRGRERPRKSQRSSCWFTEAPHLKPWCSGPQPMLTASQDGNADPNDLLKSNRGKINPGRLMAFEGAPSNQRLSLELDHRADWTVCRRLTLLYRFLLFHKPPKLEQREARKVDVAGRRSMGECGVPQASQGSRTVPSLTLFSRGGRESHHLGLHWGHRWLPYKVLGASGEPHPLT